MLCLGNPPPSRPANPRGRRSPGVHHPPDWQKERLVTVLVGTSNTLKVALLLSLTYFLIIAPASAASALLEWELSPSEDVVAYDIYFGERSGAYYGIIYVGQTNRIRVDDLVPGNDYYFAAKAITAAGLESSFSNEVCFRPAAVEPGSTLTLSRVSDGSFLLKGNGNPGMEVVIEASEDLELWSQIGTVFVNDEGVFFFLDQGESIQKFYRVTEL